MPTGFENGAIARLAATMLGLAAAIGCVRPVKPVARTITYDYDPVLVVRRHLEGYAGGIPLGKERELFTVWTEKLRATDVDTAEWLGDGLREIAASPDQAAGIASRLLAKLGQQPADGPSAADNR